ncbi:MAG: 50S ribosomal protein L3 [Leptospiraceae bacterium]|nr:50S ribosomal protein L3 [Leptospiraceae bacterium]
MAKGIIAKKLGMTQIFDENGQVIPVTVLQAGPCRVIQLKTVEKDGYTAAQLGFDKARPKLFNKAALGHQKGVEEPRRVLREFRDYSEGLEAGQELGPDVFSEGDKVKISGISKGKGFAGSVKRHGFGGGRATHGSGFHRAPGSLNATTTPGRVFKGKAMPGHKGVRRTSVLNVQVVKIDVAQNLLFVKGAVPGPRSAVVTIEALG